VSTYNNNNMKTSNNNFEMAESLLQYTAAHGGCTFLFKFPSNPITGYVVGNGKLGGKFTQYPPSAYIAQMMQHFARLGYDGLGTWVDGGTLYIDPILHVSTESEAHLYATLWDEIAYYDCAKDESVTVQLA